MNTTDDTAAEIIITPWNRAAMDEDIIEVFVEDALEIFERLDRDLVELEAQPGNSELLNLIFRSFHTLKGNSGTIKLSAMNLLAHRAETLLARIRKGECTLTAAMTDILLNCNDIFKAITQRIVDNREIDVDVLPLIRSIDAMLEEQPQDAGGTGRAEAPPAAVPATGSIPAGTLSKFIEEAEEIISSLEVAVLELEKKPDNTELCNSMFRQVHTLKGNSASINIRIMNHFAHRFETLLEQIRAQRQPVTAAAIDLMLETNDLFKEVIRRLINEEPLELADEPLSARFDQVTSTLTAGGTPTSAPAAAPAKPAPQGKPSTPTRAKPIGATNLRVGIGKLDSFMNLVGEIAIQKIRINEKIGRLSRLTQLISEAAQTLAPQTEDTVGRGCMIILQDTITGEERSLQLDRDFYEIYHEEISTLKDILSELTASTLDMHSAQRISKREQAVGELNRIATIFKASIQELAETVEHLSMITKELQEGIIQMRMVPVAQLFDKVPRIVRSLSQNLGRMVNLQRLGGETELDKTVIENLNDPLLHLIRNAIDHGLESPAERIATGKPETGTLTLSADHIGNQVVITIQDDGRGIDDQAVLQKAQAQGLITAEQANSMQRDAIFELLFIPGFSSAETVTEVSGRGVGMDVVLNNIKRLKGSVEINSTRGQGTTIAIRLPLTLAIMEVQLIKCGGHTFAVPISFIEEIITFAADDLMLIGEKTVLNLRDEVISLVRLGDVLGLPPDKLRQQQVYKALIVNIGEKRLGLVISDVIWQQEIVIKTLGNLLCNVEHVIGATILGEGAVVINLDILGIFSSARKLSGRRFDAGAAATPGAAPEPGPEADPGSQRSALVVDDSRMARAELTAMFHAAGFQVTEAADGAEALERMRTRQFDLCSIDVIMPGIDGYELVRQTRALPNYKNTPLIMVSSKGEDIDKLRGLEAGADDYLVKPIDASTLNQTLRELVHGCRKKQ